MGRYPVMDDSVLTSSRKKRSKVKPKGSDSTRTLLEPRIAILPFKNTSPGDTHNHVGEGVAAELLIWLTRLPGLHVVARSAVFSKMRKGLDHVEIGRELSATDVLVGRVRIHKDRIAISAVLTDTQSGAPIWSGDYDRAFEDVCLVLDEIAAGIVCALDSDEAPSGVRMIQHLHTKDVDAYKYYLHGREEYHEYSKFGVESAVELFKRAIEIDPSYALAYCGLADCYSYFCTYYYCNKDLLEKAFSASSKAIELDPFLAEARVSRGVAYTNCRKFKEAAEDFEDAIGLDPELFEAYYFYARNAFVRGYLFKAIDMFEEARRVRPRDYQSPLLMGQIYDALKMYDEAMEVRQAGILLAEEALKYEPNDERAWYMGANGLIGLGKKKRGLEWLQHALQLDPDDPLILYNAGCIYAMLGFTDLAMTCLEKTVAAGLLHREWFEKDSNLNSLRVHPRFEELLSSLNKRDQSHAFVADD